ncbi:hypothetical protein P170DRAFT_435744 [Aspergillus steynii IBT 23096]|uniref:Oxidoreductase-like domain-containing protein n=1 Tax=Aspergillus steynii IBT 23096 TaxID=1392250 RepID=A0A2I2GCE2_9EURO|nr:uncharacterized protein P170DRAFT_435744 [Aspergillus steynii IBT 23096]PLB50549.1 hypothetical protein P170DRAFT_435744 [Aspergillus steynii IBT 23096]
MDSRLVLSGPSLASRAVPLVEPRPRRLPFPRPAFVGQRHVSTPSLRRMASHAKATPQGTAPGLNDSASSSQAFPLSGYYYDILSSSSPYRGQASSSRPVPGQSTAKASPAATVEPQSPQDKMSIVFGTRLAGPGRSSRYDPGNTAPESTWKTVNGVAIPPRPEEPDNCCMSGCVHCVWDDFRDDMEQWAARVEQAKAKDTPQGPATEMRHRPRTEVNTASTSMDDDGGGSDTNWPVPDQTEDVFANIPVGIREFMKTEKKLKQKHRQESASS